MLFRNTSIVNLFMSDVYTSPSSGTKLYELKKAHTISCDIIDNSAVSEASAIPSIKFSYKDFLDKVAKGKSLSGAYTNVYTDSCRESTLNDMRNVLIRISNFCRCLGSLPISPDLYCTLISNEFFYDEEYVLPCKNFISLFGIDDIVVEKKNNFIVITYPNVYSERMSMVISALFLFLRVTPIMQAVKKHFTFDKSDQKEFDEFYTAGTSYNSVIKRSGAALHFKTASSYTRHYDALNKIRENFIADLIKIGSKPLSSGNDSLFIATMLYAFTAGGGSTSSQISHLTQENGPRNFGRCLALLDNVLASNLFIAFKSEIESVKVNVPFPYSAMLEGKYPVQGTIKISEASVIGD